tara:strand:+ start:1127 stop:1987 length:861 start_codon:yes stop_codon:yes gene_type:complete
MNSKLTSNRKKKINLSYASKLEHNIAQRFVIKAIELISGKKKLESIYEKYKSEDRKPIEFWSEILKVMGIKFINKSSLKISIPQKGPLIIVSNHPFGIIDGIILCSIVSEFRDNFRIMAHETLKILPELERFILPVEFKDESTKTKKNNVRTTLLARDHLLAGGLVIIFPAGGVSTAKNIRSEAIDADWKTFVAKLVHQTKSDVLPIFFDGKNSMLFHFFSTKLKSQTLKYSSYLYETRKKMGKEIEIYFGKVINYQSMKNLNDRNKLTKYLKEATFSLKSKKYND